MAGWLVVRLAIPHTIYLVQVRAEVLFMSTSFRVLVHLKTAQNTLVCCFHPIFLLFTVFSDKISMPIVEKTVFKWLGANSQTLVDTLKLVDSHFVTFFTVISSTRQPFVWYREHPRSLHKSRNNIQRSELHSAYLFSLLQVSTSIVIA